MKTVLIALLLAASPALAQSTPDAVCKNVGLITVVACARVALPTAQNDESKAFVKLVCSNAGLAAYGACKDDKLSALYQERGDCEGASLFQHDAIQVGGDLAIKDMTEAQKAKLRPVIEGWAGAVGTKLLLWCKDEKDREAKAKKDGVDL